MTISQRIFALLREKKLSQKELSEYTGISPAAISSWKSKGTNPSSDKIVKISDCDGGALYMHNAQASNVTNQKVITKNCLIKVFIIFFKRNPLSKNNLNLSLGY